MISFIGITRCICRAGGRGSNITAPEDLFWTTVWICINVEKIFLIRFSTSASSERRAHRELLWLREARHARLEHLPVPLEEEVGGDGEEGDGDKARRWGGEERVLGMLGWVTWICLTMPTSLVLAAWSGGSTSTARASAMMATTLGRLGAPPVTIQPNNPSHTINLKCLSHPPPGPPPPTWSCWRRGCGGCWPPPGRPGSCRRRAPRPRPPSRAARRTWGEGRVLDRTLAPLLTTSAAPGPG